LELDVCEAFEMLRRSLARRPTRSTIGAAVLKCGVGLPAGSVDVEEAADPIFVSARLADEQVEGRRARLASWRSRKG
jgi:hypothetical protein